MTYPRPRCKRCHARLFSDIERDGKQQSTIYHCLFCGSIERPGWEPAAMPVDKLGHSRGDRYERTPVYRR